jgi:8-oxo-dGTP diphosphatase
MTDDKERVHVAAGALFNEAGEVLIARRHDDAHQGGLWEFPGGKVAPGEAVAQAVRRELREELGVDVRAARPLIRVAHDYPDRSVLLDVWRVDGWTGEPHGLEGQAIAWVHPERLRERAFPAADVPIIAAVRLPSLYLITPEAGPDAKTFLTSLERCLARGLRLVQLRAPGLDAAAYRVLAADALALCRRHGAQLLLNAEPRLVDELGAHGVHLSSGRLRGLSGRALDASRWVAASCHDAAELARARRAGVDFAVVSPVAPTATHPGATPLGWAGFAALAAQAGMPVYALGGLGMDDLEAAWRHGGQGVAAIRSLWYARDGGEGAG